MCKRRGLRGPAGKESTPRSLTDFRGEEPETVDLRALIVNRFTFFFFRVSFFAGFKSLRVRASVVFVGSPARVSLARVQEIRKQDQLRCRVAHVAGIPGLWKGALSAERKTSSRNLPQPRNPPSCELSHYSVGRVGSYRAAPTQWTALQIE